MPLLRHAVLFLLAYNLTAVDLTAGQQDDSNQTSQRGLSADEQENCIAQVAASVAASCSGGETNTHAAFTKSLYGAASRCFLADQNMQLQVIVPNQFSAWVAQQLPTFEALTGIQTNLTAVDMSDEDQALQLLRSPVRDHYHVLLHYAGVTDDLSADDMIADVSSLVDADASLQWHDVMQLYRLQLSTYQGKTFAVPLDGTMLHLVYRRDVLQDMQADVPNTWQQLASFAASYSSRRQQTRNAPLYPICISRGAGCYKQSYLQAVWASIVQTLGPSQGVFFDPVTLDPLVNNPGFAEAIQIFSTLLKYSAPTDNEACLYSSQQFAAGDCVFSLSSFTQLKELAQQGLANGMVRQDVVRLARMPGSEVVLDRSSNQLVQCTPELCPYAMPAQYPDGSVHLVNWSPQAAISCLAGGLNRRVSMWGQFLGYQLLSYLASPSVSLQAVIDPQAPTSPYRLSHVDDSQLAMWSAAGYDLDLMHNALPIIQTSKDSPNIGWGLRMAGASFYRSGLVDLIGNLTVDPHYVIPSALQRFHTQLAAYYRPEQFLAAYQDSINYKPLPAVITTHRPHKDTVPLRTVLAVALPGAACLLLLLALVVRRVWRKRNLPRSSLRSEAPGVGPGSTLVVTDIQDSTALWEVLPADVMDTSIKLFQACVRRLLVQHEGYESATEGDSFILAFHAARPALAFALALQTELLCQPWPHPLLLHETCKPVTAPAWDGLQAKRLSLDAFVAQCSPMSTLSSLGGVSPRKHPGSGAPGGLSPRQQPDDLGALRGGSARNHPDGGTLRRSLSAGSDEYIDDLMSTGPVNASLMGTALQHSANTFGSLLQAMVQEDVRGGKKTSLAFRGLRVRIGMQSGIPSSNCFSHNAASARTTYCGEPLGLAKEMCDLAHGGMTLLTDATHTQLQAAAATDGYLPGAMMLKLGRYQLERLATTSQLYTAVTAALMPRLALLPPPRCPAEGPSLYDAPVGRPAIAVLLVADLPELLEWDRACTLSALGVLEVEVMRRLEESGGVLVSSSSIMGASQACFSTASAAAAWVLGVQRSLLDLPWPDRLLELSQWEEAEASANSTSTLSTFPSRPLPSRVSREHESGSQVASGSSTSYRVSVEGRSGLFALGSPGVSGQLMQDTQDAACPDRFTPPTTPLCRVMSEHLAPIQENLNTHKAEGAQHMVLVRGLRCRAGLDVGHVDWTLNPATSSLEYHGRPLHRARKLADRAQSGQVLCSLKAREQIRETQAGGGGEAAGCGEAGGLVPISTTGLVIGTGRSTHVAYVCSVAKDWDAVTHTGSDSAGASTTPRGIPRASYYRSITHVLGQYLRRSSAAGSSSADGTQLHSGPVSGPLASYGPSTSLSGPSLSSQQIAGALSRRSPSCRLSFRSASSSLGQRPHTSSSFPRSFLSQGSSNVEIEEGDLATCGRPSPPNPPVMPGLPALTNAVSSVEPVFPPVLPRLLSARAATNMSAGAGLRSAPMLHLPDDPVCHPPSSMYVFRRVDTAEGEGGPGNSSSSGPRLSGGVTGEAPGTSQDGSSSTSWFILRPPHCMLQPSARAAAAAGPQQNCSEIMEEPDQLGSMQ